MNHVLSRETHLFPWVSILSFPLTHVHTAKAWKGVLAIVRKKCQGLHSRCCGNRSIYSLSIWFSIFATRALQSRQAFVPEVPIDVETKIEGTECRSVFLTIRNCRELEEDPPKRFKDRDEKNRSLDNTHSVVFCPRSSSPRLIEDETFIESDIINNLIDYEDGQEEPDSSRADKTM
ncbi:hypothetical protein TNCV_4923701 [Trichonephila clavipes]|nr:hypothetical protein TNCV_4923701 [Trichonephila clavipes]